VYDPGEHDVGDDPDGFSGAVFDGRYVYFVPCHNGTAYTAEVLRYDTTASFLTSDSWAAYDPRSKGVGHSANGFAGAVYDGRYVYFIPHSDNAATEEDVLRYDTLGNFAEVSSWAAFDPVSSGVAGAADGHHGGTFDGRYMYFSPANYHQDTHGAVLRYDTLVDCNHNGIQDDCDLNCGSADGRCDVAGCGLSVDENDNGVPDECEPPIPTISQWGLAVMMLLLLVGGTIVITRRRIWGASLCS
jgi:hypothetical protein